MPYPLWGLDTVRASDRMEDGKKAVVGHMTSAGCWELGRRNWVCPEYPQPM